MTVFNFNASARSRMAMSSAFCWAVGRPGLEGQQELPTVATHSARNSRRGGGGTIFSTGTGSSAANKFVAKKKRIPQIIRALIPRTVAADVRRFHLTFRKQSLSLLTSAATRLMENRDRAIRVSL